MSARYEPSEAPVLRTEGAATEAKVTEQALPGVSLEDFLPASPRPDATAPQVAARAVVASPAVSMRTAHVKSLIGRRARIVLRGRSGEIDAAIAPEVEIEIITEAYANGEAVLVEIGEDGAPLIVAALLTRRPRELRIKACTIAIEAEREVILRSGQGAIRLREDGEIEIVGSRISAASRGLFRIVGRILRLN